MTPPAIRGDRIGEALNFGPGASTTTVEIGLVGFAATATVTLTLAPASFDPVAGVPAGGAGAVTGLTVTASTGQITTFGVSAQNPLDADPELRNLTVEGKPSRRHRFKPGGERRTGAGPAA
jgi:hypothetical protein